MTSRSHGPSTRSSTSAAHSPRVSARVARTLALATLATLVAAHSSAQSTELVSTTPNGAAANGTSFLTQLSPDGRFVLFASSATNLVAGDTNATYDVFLRDRQFGTTERVSVGTGGFEANGLSSSSGISADGRFVVFQSSATNLVTPPTSGFPAIYVRDRTLGTTSLVSTSTAGVRANERCDRPVISRDGRYVLFGSRADNLVPGDNSPPFTDVFRRDLVTGVTECVSVDASGSPAGSLCYQERGDPALSADGRFVAFLALGTIITPPVFAANRCAFVRDMQLGVTTIVSVATNGTPANSDSQTVTISPDARFVAFETSASNLAPQGAGVFRDAYVRDLVLGTTTVASRPTSGPVQHLNGGPGIYPAIAGSGGVVGFFSNATTLVAGDTNAEEDLFLCELGSNTITRVDIDSLGGQLAQGCRSYAFAAALSDDARVFAFTTLSTALAPFDTNSGEDVFVVDRFAVTAKFCGSGGAGATACPCAQGNAGRGCANSAFANGAELVASGDTSVTNDTLHLDASALTGGVAVFFFGDAASAPFALDDGLGCVGGSIVRVGTKPVGGNASVCPEPGDPALSQALGMPAAGGRRFAQCVYRNAASFCTSSTSNRTNAVAVTFTP